MMLAGVTIYVSITRVTYVLQVLLLLPFRLPMFLLFPFPLRLLLFILLLVSFQLATTTSLVTSCSCFSTFSCQILSSFHLPILCLLPFLPLSFHLPHFFSCLCSIPAAISMSDHIYALALDTTITHTLVHKKLMSLLPHTCPFRSGQYSPSPRALLYSP